MHTEAILCGILFVNSRDILPHLFDCFCGNSLCTFFYRPISKSIDDKELLEVSLRVEDERLHEKTSPMKTQMNHISHNLPPSESPSVVSTKNI